MIPRADHRLKRLLFWVGVFLAVAIVNYFPILGGKIPLPSHVVTDFPPWEGRPITMEAPPNRAEYGDIVTIFYPWRHFQGTAAQVGELPLWNPHILSGSPF